MWPEYVLLFKKLKNCFPEWLGYFQVPPAMCPVSQHSCQHLVLSLLFLFYFIHSKGPCNEVSLWVEFALA